VEKPKAIRRTLSATEMVTLYGCSPYSGASEHQVFVDHVYPEKPEPQEGKPLWMRLGSVVEPLSLELLAETTGQTLRRARTRASAKYPWLVARPDALAVPLTDMEHGKALRLPALGPTGARRAKVHAVCEAKFISDPRMAQLWFDMRPAPPLYVQVQAQVEMTVFGVRKACGIGIVMGNPYVWEMEHDPELEEEIVAIGQNFLSNHIDTGNAPAWDGSKAADRLLMRRYPSPDATFYRADLASNALAVEYIETQKAIDVLQTKRDITEQKLKELIGDRIGIVGETWKVTWKAPKVGWISWMGVAHEIAGRRGVSRAIVTKHTGEPTRRFRMFDRDPKAGQVVEGLDIDEALEAAASAD
jgi:hypothetical protein